MREPHLLQVARPAEEFALVVAAVTEAGGRVGWLELGEATPPPGLARAAALGVLRAVAVGSAGAVVVKPRRGRPVLRDLMREHFLGCRLVLVAGDDPALPRLEPDEAGWRVTHPDGGQEVWSLAELVARIARPRPFGARRATLVDPGAEG